MVQNSTLNRLLSRLYLPDDYATLRKWWNAHGTYPPKPQHLSTTGIIVEAGGIPISGGFLYHTDSKICVFEFVIVDPEAPKELRDACLNFLIEEIKSLARKRGYELIYSSVRGEKYISRLINAGFIITDRDQVHVFCELGG